MTTHPLIVTAVPAREVDIPYWTSPPVQFLYESTATLALGQYTWADAPTALTVVRPILPNALYYFRSITLSADVADLDYSANITTRPQFYMFLRGDSRAILFREPIQFPMFLNQFEYRFFWMARRTNEALLAAFTGVLNQGANLIGKASITLKAVISAQEIIDDAYIENFKKVYNMGVDR